MPTNNPYPDLYDFNGLEIMYKDAANQLVTLPEYFNRDGLSYLIYIINDLRDINETMIPGCIDDLTGDCTVMLAYDAAGDIIRNGWLRASLLMRLCSHRGRALARTWKRRPMLDDCDLFPFTYELTLDQVIQLLGRSAEFWVDQGCCFEFGNGSGPAMSIYMPQIIQSYIDPADCFIVHNNTWADQVDMFRRLLAGFMDRSFALSGMSIPIRYEPGTEPLGEIYMTPDMITNEVLNAYGLDESFLARPDEAEFIYQHLVSKFPDSYENNYVSLNMIKYRIANKLLLVMRNEEGKIEMFAVTKHRRHFGFVDYFIRIPDSKHRGLCPTMTEVCKCYGRMRGWRVLGVCYRADSEFLRNLYTSIGFRSEPRFNSITSYVGH